MLDADDPRDKQGGEGARLGKSDRRGDEGIGRQVFSQQPGEHCHREEGGEVPEVLDDGVQLEGGRTNLQRSVRKAG